MAPLAPSLLVRESEQINSAPKPGEECLVSGLPDVGEAKVQVLEVVIVAGWPSFGEL